MVEENSILSFLKSEIIWTVFFLSMNLLSIYKELNMLLVLVSEGKYTLMKAKNNLELKCIGIVFLVKRFI